MAPRAHRLRRLERVGRRGARESWARLHGVAEADVAIGPQVSPFVGIVAASLEPGSRVLCAEEDFTSVLFPWLAQDLRRRVRAARPAAPTR